MKRHSSKWLTKNKCLIHLYSIPLLFFFTILQIKHFNKSIYIVLFWIRLDDKNKNFRKKKYFVIHFGTYIVTIGGLYYNIVILYFVTYPYTQFIKNKWTRLWDVTYFWKYGKGEQSKCWFIFLFWFYWCSPATNVLSHDIVYYFFSGNNF